MRSEGSVIGRGRWCIPRHAAEDTPYGLQSAVRRVSVERVRVDYGGSVARRSALSITGVVILWKVPETWQHRA